MFPTRRRVEREHAAQAESPAPRGPVRHDHPHRGRVELGLSALASLVVVDRVGGAMDHQHPGALGEVVSEHRRRLGLPAGARRLAAHRVGSEEAVHRVAALLSCARWGVMARVLSGGRSGHEPGGEHDSELHALASAERTFRPSAPPEPARELAHELRGAFEAHLARADRVGVGQAPQPDAIEDAEVGRHDQVGVEARRLQAHRRLLALEDQPHARALLPGELELHDHARGRQALEMDAPPDLPDQERRSSSSGRGSPNAQRAPQRPRRSTTAVSSSPAGVSRYSVECGRSPTWRATTSASSSARSRVESSVREMLSSPRLISLKCDEPRQQLANTEGRPAVGEDLRSRATGQYCCFPHAAIFPPLRPARQVPKLHRATSDFSTSRCATRSLASRLSKEASCRAGKSLSSPNHPADVAARALVRRRTR